MSNQIPVRNLDSDTNFFVDAGKKIQTRSFTGVYRRIRIAAGTALFALYFLTAWLTWNGRQAVLWDLGSRQFHIFSQTLWPQDLILLSAVLIIAAYGLFLLALLGGRIWCGYLCPQSVFTWVFMWAEKIAEGDRNQRIKLDNASMSANKFIRRANKHLLWLSISFITGFTFVGYFTPIRDLAVQLVTFEAGGATYFWIFFFTAATYLNAGWLREKVCFHMCPYGRFQSSICDNDTLLISYDSQRGEPRGNRKKGVYRDQTQGDCIDCTMCVQVCPTGIDIRDGLQMECIGCAACIDACDNVMDKMGYAKGLIRYASENSMTGKSSRLLRPSFVGYGALFIIMLGFLAWGFSSRSLIGLNVAKDRMLYRYNTERNIENIYRVKIFNKDQVMRTYTLDISGMPGAKIKGETRYVLAPGEMYDFNLIVAVDPTQVGQSVSKLSFNVKDEEDNLQSHTVKTTFTAPVL